MTDDEMEDEFDEDSGQEDDDGPPCPFCDDTGLECEHVALLFEPGEGIGGGAAYSEAEEFLSSLDEALVGSAATGADLVRGACRDLCKEAVSLTRRRKLPIDPADAASELDLARFELLEEILGAIRGVRIVRNEVAYGGFAAEGAGKVVWERRPGSVEERLSKEIRALDIDWDEERERRLPRKRKAAGKGTAGSTKA